MLTELGSEVLEKLRTGVVECPRAGYLRAPPKERIARASKGQSKGQKKHAALAHNKFPKLS